MNEKENCNKIVRSEIWMQKRERLGKLENDY